MRYFGLDVHKSYCEGAGLLPDGTTRRFRPSLKSSRLSVRQSELQREEAAEAVTFTPVQGTSYDRSFEAKWYSLLTADLNWQMSRKRYAAAEDAVVPATCQRYWAV